MHVGMCHGCPAEHAPHSTHCSTCRCCVAVVPPGFYLKSPGQVAPCPQGEWKADVGASANCTKCATTGVITPQVASTSEAECNSKCAPVLPRHPCLSSKACAAHAALHTAQCHLCLARRWLWSLMLLMDFMPASTPGPAFFSCMQCCCRDTLPWKSVQRVPLQEPHGVPRSTGE
jgi:hypothetical protein